jgi:hypothetical protein
MAASQNSALAEMLTKQSIYVLVVPGHNLLNIVAQCLYQIEVRGARERVQTICPTLGTHRGSVSLLATFWRG